MNRFIMLWTIWMFIVGAVAWLLRTSLPLGSAGSHRCRRRDDLKGKKEGQMYFLVTIRTAAGSYVWSIVVEAEDRDGAVREASHALERREGWTLNTFRSERRGPYSVSVDPVERSRVEEIDRWLGAVLKAGR